MSPRLVKRLDDYVKENTLPDGSLRHDDVAVIVDTFTNNQLKYSILKSPI